ncbi:hypothetical protein ACJJTC_003540 [Scirpophaga incertulas]
MEVVLYNSNVCRLCGEENDNGTLLFSCEENNQNLSELINSYLPIKVTDDGQLPRTICPGCTIQLEATVEFLNLIVSGQKILRQLHQREKEYKKNLVIETPREDEIVTEEIIYEMDHPISLQMAGLDKPKRKRGRPPKKLNPKEDPPVEITIPVRHKTKIDTTEDVSGKRRRQTPIRFKEVIQGKELERIFKEEGVTDGEDSDNELKHDIRPDISPVIQKEPEVIGHMENSGELVVVVKGKGRGRPKGRLRVTREECAICGAQFGNVGRYMSHVAQHGPVRYQCAQCRTVFPTRLLFAGHQADAHHVGQIILPSEDEKLENVVKAEIDVQDVDPVASEVATATDAATTLGLLDLDALKVEGADQTLKGVVDQEDAQEEVTSDVIQVAENGIDAPTAPQMDVEEVVLEANVPTAKEKAKLKCNYCDKVFSNKQSKSLHTKVLNHPSSVVYHKEAEHAGQRYVCGKCGKSFKHKQLLKRHQLVHSQLRPYTCKMLMYCVDENCTKVDIRTCN